MTYLESTEYDRIIIGKDGNAEYGISPDNLRSDDAVAYVSKKSPYGVKALGEPTDIDPLFQLI